MILAPKTAFQDAHHGQIEGKTRGYHAVLMLIGAAWDPHHSPGSVIGYPPELSSLPERAKSALWLSLGYPWAFSDLTNPLKVVPGAGLEPARIVNPRDFKSLASTRSATQAGGMVHTVFT